MKFIKNLKKEIKDMLNFLAYDFSKRASSRKFLVLIIGTCLHLKDSKGFTGDNMVWVFGVYMGANVIEKLIDKMK